MIVDCHCHVIAEEMTTAAVPERWRPEITRSDGRQLVGFRGNVLRSIVGEFTDPELMLAQAAAEGIDHLVLSPWVMLIPSGTDTAAGPGGAIGAGGGSGGSGASGAADAVSLAEALDVCRVQNEALSRIAAAHPGRISALGAVPVGYPEAAAAELARLLRLPGMRGIEIPASANGAYLGDDRYTPLWEAAQETGAAVFVHPTTRGLGIPALNDHYLWNSVGNPLETAITAAHLAATGVLERFPGLKLLLAHGGGGLQAIRGRLRRAFGVRPEAASRGPAGPDTALRAFWYDSLTHDRALLAGLVAYAGPGRVVLGSDRPFDMGSATTVAEVRDLGLPAEDEEQILGGSAAALLGLPGAPAGASLPAHARASLSGAGEGRPGPP